MEGPTDKKARALDPRRLRSGAIAAVGIGVIAGAVVVFVVDGPSVLAGLQSMSPWWFAVALALTVVSWFGQGFGFAALTRRGVRGNVSRMTSAFLAGDFPALVTPFGSGGIPGGVFALTRDGLSTGEASAVIAMHSLLTAAFFILTGAATVLVLPLHSAGPTALFWSGFATIAVMLGLVVWVVLRPQAASGRLRRVLGAGPATRILGSDRAARWADAAGRETSHFAADVRRVTRERPSALAASFGGLAVSRACVILALPAIMVGLGWHGDVLPLLGTAVGASALMIASPTPGGSGAVEVATTALLATQVPAPVAAAAALLWRVATYYSEVLVGWIVLSHYIARSPGAPAIGEAE